MKQIALAILATLLIMQNFAHAAERKLYVGSDSSEAQMTFDHYVVVTGARAPSKTRANQIIEDQLQHMFGAMEANIVKAVPRGSHTVTINSITKQDIKKYLVSYSYEGTVVLHNSAGPVYSFNLPNDPKAIYTAAMVGEHNPCTDEHYQSEGDFWYFWNPKNSGCNLKEGLDYTNVKGKIKRIANTTSTYPEYERLIDSKGVVKITLLMGMDDPTLSNNPNRSSDINAGNFRDIKASLLRDGYTNKLATDAELKAVLPKKIAKPYVENFKKEITNNGVTRTIWLQIFFGPSGIDEESAAFHYFFKDALENSAIMMYDGHSGLGGHLDLESIEYNQDFVIRPPQNKYQIYFFNSCSSYSYYNTMFFARKATEADPRGTKNLDILTNGLATYFYVMHDTNWAVVKAVEHYLSGKQKISYQLLARQIDSGNLFGVNGDEDNPKK